MPDSVPASVVIRRGFRGMQEGDVPRVPPSNPFVEVTPASERESPLHCDSSADEIIHILLGTNVPSYYRIYLLSITDKCKEFIKNLLRESLLTIC